MSTDGAQQHPEDLAPGDEAPPEEPSSGENICEQCSGTGKLDGDACSTCGGSGTVIEAVGGG